MDLDSLGEALRRQWNGDGVSDQVTSLLENIANGKVSESMLVTLDIEFWLPSRKVFEVGMTTIHSRKVLMNTRTKHDCSGEDLLRLATQRMQPQPPKRLLLDTVPCGPYTEQTEITVQDSKMFTKWPRSFGRLVSRQNLSFYHGIPRLLT